MPYVEVIAPPSGAVRRAAFVRASTDALTTLFGVSAQTVTVYFVPVPTDGYGHDGELRHYDGPHARVLIKVHAYRRGVDIKRQAAAALTDAFAAASGAHPERIAVYFFDRAHDEVAHAGRLSCDPE